MSILRYKQKLLPLGNPQGGGGKGGGGGGSAPQQTTQQSNQFASLSPWAQPYITSLLGAGQAQVFQTAPNTTDENGNVVQGQITGINPYQAYGSFNTATGGQYGMTPSDIAAANASVAGFTPLQQQAYTGASGLTMPSNYAQATGAAGLGTGQALTAQGRYQAEATNPYAVGAYMNPYVAQSLAPQLQLLAQQGGIQSAAQQGAATQAGAFGGSRSTLANALAQQNNLLAQQQAIAQGYNTAFGQAQQAMQYGAGLGMQGAQTGISGAGQLANIGGQSLQAQQGILGLQNQFGGQQQQQAQNIINAGMTNYQTAQQYPMTQLGQLKGLISGIPVTDVTTTAQQAQPSTATQLAGLGTAGVAGLALASKAAEGGIMKSYAAGGKVEGYAPGGIAALNRKALLNPTSMSPQTLDRSTKDGAIAPEVSGIARAIQLSEQVNAKNSDALSKPPVEGTVVGDLEAKASEMDQAEAMQDAIPKAMAVLKHKMDRAIEDGNIPLAKKYAAELQQLAEIVQQEAPASKGIEQIAPQVQQVAQAPEQGIDSATSNLPEQAMAKGGIAQMLADADEEERLAADEEELYGTGAENDFIQSIMPAARQSGTTHPSAAVSVRFEPKDGEGIDKLSSHKYASLVAAEAKRQGRDPNVILKMLQKETGGLKNPETARSKAGAIGIAQFMPKTAKQYGINPEIPEEAAYGMVKHFGYLEDKYGDPKLAMAAYNWGEGNLNKWLKAGADPRKLPEETRKYASLAQGGIAHYDGEDGSLVKTDTDQALNTKPLTGLDALQAEILQDIKTRKEESKKTREQNNLLALASMGLGMASSKNISPLGAIAEGGQQGIGTLMAGRKQEAEEAKDIAAQQIGAYRFGATAENARVLQDIKQAQQDLRKGPEERARDEAEREYSRQVAAIDKRQAEQAKQAGGELDPYYQEQYDAQRSALRKQIYEHFKVPVQTDFKLPPIKTKPVKVEPTGYQKVMPSFLGGMSKEDMEALQWANDNPEDPRADAIKKRLGK